MKFIVVLYSYIFTELLFLPANLIYDVYCMQVLYCSLRCTAVATQHQVNFVKKYLVLGVEII